MDDDKKENKNCWSQLVFVWATEDKICQRLNLPSYVSTQLSSASFNRPKCPRCCVLAICLVSCWKMFLTVGPLTVSVTCSGFWLREQHFVHRMGGGGGGREGGRERETTTTERRLSVVVVNWAGSEERGILESQSSSGICVWYLPLKSSHLASVQHQ